MNPFGRLPIRHAAKVAATKYRSCPWHFYDGVPDCEPNRLLWGDFAITRVMSSALRADLIEEARQRAAQGGAEQHLTAIPHEYDLVLAEEEDQKVYESIDSIFGVLRGPHFRMSRVAKVLCRKRPYSIPMLDRVITDFLDGVCSHWRKSPSSAPTWFAECWSGWTDRQPVPYLRMIRLDARAHVGELKAIRESLQSDPTLGVPAHASLLRIWEATVFWHLYTRP